GNTSPAQPRPNQPFQYQFVVTNAGPLLATQVALTDTLAANLAVTAISSSQGSCSQTAPQEIRCALGSLAPAGNITVVLTVVAAQVGNYENAVQVSADQVDSDCSDNVAQLLTTVSDTFSVYLPVVQRP
ncbi:MAG: DUF11 domain-containing protein, partial [Anaerolineales bacterium]|nr:DUF11 domain-containing protein [Anaerolineales bacterium]